MAPLTSDNEGWVEEIVHPDYRDHTLHGLARGPECFGRCTGGCGGRLPTSS